MDEVKRRAILIAGMHRSGTSATARVLNLLGCDIPGTLVPASHGNNSGHWEPQAIVDLHEGMLRAAQVNVNGVLGVNPVWFHTSSAECQVNATAEMLRHLLRDVPFPVIKDPRMGLFIPIWRRALERLGVEGVFVFPFRDPAEVASSLCRRQSYFYPDTVWPLARGTLLWLRYVLAAERASRGARRSFLFYDALLSGWTAETKRVAEQLGLNWPRTNISAAQAVNAFLSCELKHENLDRRGDFPLAYRVFDQMIACVERPNDGGNVFDAASDELDRASGLLGEYVSELELRLGAHPTLRTEFVDFVRQTEEELDELSGFEKKSNLLEAGEKPVDAERREALLISVQSGRRVLAEQVAELETFNAALLEAARRSEFASSSDLKEAAMAREAAERRAVHETAVRAEAQHAASTADARASGLIAKAEADMVERDRVARELAGAEAEARAALTERDHLQAKCEAVAEERRRIEDELQKRLAELSAARLENHTLHEAAIEAHEQIQKILSSRAWRLTAPIRLIMSLLSARTDRGGPERHVSSQ